MQWLECTVPGGDDPEELCNALAELGVGSAICYRFYKPIAVGDVVQVGRLMRFFRQVYHLVALVVLALGLALFPFIGSLVKDASDVPAT